MYFIHVYHKKEVSTIVKIPEAKSQVLVDKMRIRRGRKEPPIYQTLSKPIQNQSYVCTMYIIYSLPEMFQKKNGVKGAGPKKSIHLRGRRGQEGFPPPPPSPPLGSYRVKGAL